MKSAEDNSPPIEQADAKPSKVEVIFLILGSLGLATSFLTDTFAVIGRHTGFAFIGSIEIVQASIVFFATSAMLAATFSRQHAKVQLLTERVSPARAKVLAYISAYISAFYCVLLFIGSLWVAFETWNEHERSELLHIPLSELRLILAATLFLMAFYFLFRQVSATKVNPNSASHSSNTSVEKS